MEENRTETTNKKGGGKKILLLAIAGGIGYLIYKNSLEKNGDKKETPKNQNNATTTTGNVCAGIDAKAINDKITELEKLLERKNAEVISLKNEAENKIKKLDAETGYKLNQVNQIGKDLGKKIGEVRTMQEEVQRFLKESKEEKEQLSKLVNSFNDMVKDTKITLQKDRAFYLEKIKDLRNEIDRIRP